MEGGRRRRRRARTTRGGGGSLVPMMVAPRVALKSEAVREKAEALGVTRQMLPGAAAGAAWEGAKNAANLVRMQQMKNKSGVANR